MAYRAGSVALSGEQRFMFQLDQEGWSLEDHAIRHLSAGVQEGSTRN